MDFVIMAAGRGSRLMPLTKDKPKCLVEVNGKPIIKHIYDNICKNISKPNLYIICGYKKKVLIDYCYKNKIDAEFIYQNRLDGTANAIFMTNPYIKEDFVVLSGDIIYSAEEIKKLMDNKNSLLYTEMNDRLYEYGTMEIRELVGYDGYYVTRINEKSTEPISNFVNCGAYHFDLDIYEYIAETEYDQRFAEKIITNTIGLMVKDGILFKAIQIDSLNEVSYQKDIIKVENRLDGI